MERNRYLVPLRLFGQVSIKTLILVCFFLLPLFCLVSSAAVITVPGDYSTIQAAINAANDGDEIIVSPGTYRNINFIGKNIILRSTNPTNPTVVANTIIDGNQDGSVVTFSGTENGSCVLTGLTIINGFAQLGGGINGNGTLATIQNNGITSNTVFASYPYGLGGGLYDCDGAILNNAIYGNSAGRGGGLYDCDGTVQNNAIFGNESVFGVGGGLSYCDGSIQSNIISDNWADVGGGLFRCDGMIQNNIISDNSADWGGGVEDCGGTIQYNTIFGNSAQRDGGGVRYCDGTIQYNIISGNSAGEHGGGLDECAATVQNNTITSNSAILGGGGLASCNGIVQNNAIFGNSASESGGGLHGCDFRIRNNTIYGNSAGQSGGGISECSGTIRNCIIWQNTSPIGGQLDSCSSPSYCCIQDWSGGGAGNISDDPELVDPANGDFHLLPDSPCIDAGCFSTELTEDFEGDPRPCDGTSELRGDGSDFDIGADEYCVGPIPTPTPTPTPGPTPTPIAPPYTFNFDTGADGWTFSGAIIPFDPPAQTSSGGHLGLSPAGSSLCFGFWDSPEILVQNGVTYRAEFSLASSLSTGELVPQCRLRFYQVNGYGSATREVISGGDGGGAPVTTPRTYDVLFTPLLSGAEGTVTLSFDILNFDPFDDANAWLYLESVTIEEVSVSP